MSSFSKVITPYNKLYTTFKKDPIQDNRIKAFFFHRRIELKILLTKDNLNLYNIINLFDVTSSPWQRWYAYTYAHSLQTKFYNKLNLHEKQYTFFSLIEEQVVSTATVYSR